MKEEETKDNGLSVVTISTPSFPAIEKMIRVKVGPPVHNYEHEAGSYGDGFT